MRQIVVQLSLIPRSSPVLLLITCGMVVKALYIMNGITLVGWSPSDTKYPHDKSIQMAFKKIFSNYLASLIVYVHYVIFISAKRSCQNNEAIVLEY